MYKLVASLAMCTIKSRCLLALFAHRASGAPKDAAFMRLFIAPHMAVACVQPPFLAPPSLCVCINRLIWLNNETLLRFFFENLCIEKINNVLIFLITDCQYGAAFPGFGISLNPWLDAAYFSHTWQSYGSLVKGNYHHSKIIKKRE